MQRASGSVSTRPAGLETDARTGRAVQAVLCRLCSSVAIGLRCARGRSVTGSVYSGRRVGEEPRLRAAGKLRGCERVHSNLSALGTHVVQSICSGHPRGHERSEALGESGSDDTRDDGHGHVRAWARPSVFTTVGQARTDRTSGKGGGGMSPRICACCGRREASVVPPNHGNACQRRGTVKCARKRADS